jgi:hypothetical protein
VRKRPPISWAISFYAGFWHSLSGYEIFTRFIYERAIAMKNPHIESLKLLAKQHHRTRSGGHFDKGIKTYHRYDDLPSERLTWWDDVAFILNDYRVELAWHHPRMAYEDAIEAEVDRLVLDLLSSHVMRESVTDYKTVGKSPKQIAHTVYEPAMIINKDQWRQARQQAMRTANFEIRPFLKSQWCKNSRIIYLCAPIEIRN